MLAFVFVHEDVHILFVFCSWYCLFCLVSKIRNRSDVSHITLCGTRRGARPYQGRDPVEGDQAHGRVNVALPRPSEQLQMNSLFIAMAEFDADDGADVNDVITVTVTCSELRVSCLTARPGMTIVSTCAVL